MTPQRVTKKGDRLYFNDRAWIVLGDYESLQVALREALDGWALLQSSVNCHLGRGGITLPISAIEDHMPRITELRAQFLDDK